MEIEVHNSGSLPLSRARVGRNFPSNRVEPRGIKRLCVHTEALFYMRINRGLGE